MIHPLTSPTALTDPMVTSAGLGPDTVIKLLAFGALMEKLMGAVPETGPPLQHAPPAGAAAVTGPGPGPVGVGPDGLPLAAQAAPPFPWEASARPFTVVPTPAAPTVPVPTEGAPATVRADGTPGPGGPTGAVASAVLAAVTPGNARSAGVARSPVPGRGVAEPAPPVAPDPVVATVQGGEPEPVRGPAGGLAPEADATGPDLARPDRPPPRAEPPWIRAADLRVRPPAPPLDLRAGSPSWSPGESPAPSPIAAAVAVPQPPVVAAPAATPAPVPGTGLGLVLTEAFRALRKQGDGTWRMTIRLDPPELGRVRLEVVSRGDQVHLVLRTEFASSQATLTGRRDEIERLLQHQGFSLGSFDVGEGTPEERRFSGPPPRRPGRQERPDHSPSADAAPVRSGELRI